MAPKIAEERPAVPPEALPPKGLARRRPEHQRSGMDFTEMKCAPCKKGAPPKTPAEVDEAMRSLAGWAAQEGKTRIHKRYRFKDFVEAMRFVNALAGLAEAEGHHPDFAVHWNTVDVTLWTHDVGGLSQNDFIVAAKLDALPEGRGARAE